MAGEGRKLINVRELKQRVITLEEKVSTLEKFLLNVPNTKVNNTLSFTQREMEIIVSALELGLDEIENYDDEDFFDLDEEPEFTLEETTAIRDRFVKETNYLPFNKR